MLSRFLKNTNRFELVKIVIGVAFFVQVLISYPLWLQTAREFPLVPMLGTSIAAAGVFVHWALFGVLIISILSLLFVKNVSLSSRLFLGVLFLFFALDATRLQAWAYQYSLMILVLAAIPFFKTAKKIRPSPPTLPQTTASTSKKNKSKKSKPTNDNPQFIGSKTFSAHHPYALLALQLVLIFTYIWSGIQKMNANFADDIYPWMLSAFPFLEPLAEISALGYGVAAIESLLGIGLFFTLTRRFAIWATSLFHLIILVLLISLKWNEVVWAWNVAMIAFVWLLFAEVSFFKNTARVSWRDLGLKKLGFAPIASFSLVILLLGVMPVFNFFEKWDEQLSLKMYSGASGEAVFYFNDEDLTCVPTPQLKEVSEGLYPQEGRINLDDWTMNELKVPAYGSDWAYKKAGVELCKCVTEPGLAGIEISDSPRWVIQREIKVIPCNKLLRLAK